jgi:hypothetical protein
MKNYDSEDNVGEKSMKNKKDFFAYHKTKKKDRDLKRKNDRNNKNRW